MASLREFLKRFNFTELQINVGILQTTIQFQDADKAAAWELYVELLTRVTTQFLQPEEGDEEAALTSVFSLFGLTRESIKRHGPHCINFAKIAIVILNQVIRPFTAKWHKLSLAGAFHKEDQRIAFRNDLRKIQEQLRQYTKLLAEIADVEDLTELERE